MFGFIAELAGVAALYSLRGGIPPTGGDLGASVFRGGGGLRYICRVIRCDCYSSLGLIFLRGTCGCKAKGMHGTTFTRAGAWLQCCDLILYETVIYKSYLCI